MFMNMNIYEVFNFRLCPDISAELFFSCYITQDVRLMCLFIDKYKTFFLYLNI